MACSNVCVCFTCGGVWQVVMCVCLFHLQVPVAGHGMGRRGQLGCAVTVEEAVAAVKTHLKLPHVRLARASGGCTGTSRNKANSRA